MNASESLIMIADKNGMCIWMVVEIVCIVGISILGTGCDVLGGGYRSVIMWLKRDGGDVANLVTICGEVAAALVWFFRKVICRVARSAWGRLKSDQQVHFSTVDQPDAVFVGREKEMSELALELGRSNMVVIHGVGGEGKSELVIRHIHNNRANFPGGCFQVDMEGVADWAKVFLQVIRRSSAEGIRAEEYLGVQIAEEDRDAGSSIRLAARIRDALLRTASRRGRILLFLDNVENVGELFSSLSLRQAFQAGFSEKMPIQIVATTRFIDSGLDENVSDIPLHGLSEDCGVELLTSMVPASSDIEKDAARKIVRFLGCRALYIRRIPGLFCDRFTPKCHNSYVEVLAELEAHPNDLIESVTDEKHIPVLLWTLIRNRLRGSARGNSLLKFAEIIAIMPQECVRRDVLLYVWYDLVDGRQAKNMGSVPAEFLRDVELLRNLHILSSASPIKMHRLDAEAIAAVTETESPLFEKSIGRSLSQYPGMDREYWARMAPHANVTAEIPDRILDGRLIAKMILRNETYLGRYQLSRLNGADWVRLLRKKPELASQCEWNKLNGADWSNLLRDRPEFCENCDFSLFSSGDWVNLLSAQPDFAEKCKMDAFECRYWAKLVASQVVFAQRCPFSRFGGSHWSVVLSAQPAFEKICCWEKLNGKDWASLLVAQPQFANLCQWQLLCGADWAMLLGARPAFSDYCVWGKLRGEDWATLVIKQPVYLRMCRWEKFNARAWRILLRGNPKYFEFCPNQELGMNVWCDLVRLRPELEPLCPWDRFTGAMWGRLLSTHPQYYYRCSWDCLSNKNWTKLLKKQPQLFIFRTDEK